eukprot:TRINITY_DN6516_c0_g1_i2.p1 TRINITY_DN6516_c0_g1~~TRINITY_DN6516_c0_g1_i2.p1  ORF type:complete len:106 (+),score=10.33 TRINITY_DN6516_c0_g1_i2:210-527(+)
MTAEDAMRAPYFKALGSLVQELPHRTSLLCSHLVLCRICYSPPSPDFEWKANAQLLPRSDGSYKVSSVEESIFTASQLPYHEEPQLRQAERRKFEKQQRRTSLAF